MNSLGPRRGWQNQPSSAQPDLAKRAVLGGGVLTLVLVLSAFVTGFWGGGPPSVDPPPATSSAAALGTDLEPAKSGSGSSDSESEPGKSAQSGSGKSDSGKSDSGKSDSGKSDSGKSDSGTSDSGTSGSGKSGSGKSEKSGRSGSGDDSSSSDDSGKSGKKQGPSSSPSSPDGSGVLAGLGDAFSPLGSSSTSTGGVSSTRMLPPNFSVPSRRSSTGLNRMPGSGPSNGTGDDSDSTESTDNTDGPGGGYTRRAGGSTTCTTVVSDRASLDRELQDVGPDEVVCLRGSTRASSGSRGLPGGFGGSVADGAKTSPDLARTPGSGSRSTTSYVGPRQSSGSISLGSGSTDGGKCTQEVTDSAGFERALKGARDGEKVCVGVGDLGIRLEVSKGGASGLSIQIAGLGELSSKGIAVQTDDIQAENNNIGRVTR